MATHFTKLPEGTLGTSLQLSSLSFQNMNGHISPACIQGHHEDLLRKVLEKSDVLTYTQQIGRAFWGRPFGNMKLKPLRHAYSPITSSTRRRPWGKIMDE